MANKDKKRFGDALSKQLKAHATTASSVAGTMGVSRAYMSNLTSGKKSASPERIDEIARILGLSETDAGKLHVAAAQDLGFKIELPDDDEF